MKEYYEKLKVYEKIGYYLEECLSTEDRPTSVPIYKLRISYRGDVIYSKSSPGRHEIIFMLSIIEEHNRNQKINEILK